MASGWAVVRILQPSATTDQPVVRVVPPWRIHLADRTCTLLDEDALQHQPDHHFAFRSPAELVFFLVGPRALTTTATPATTTIPTTTATPATTATTTTIAQPSCPGAPTVYNVYARWGNEATLCIIGNNKICQPMAPAQTFLRDDDDIQEGGEAQQQRWAGAFVDTSLKNSPPPFGHGHSRGCLEVHSKLSYGAQLRVRLEHFSADRIPYSQYWRKICRGGYGAEVANNGVAALQLKSRAAFAWIFASKAAVVDSNWLQLLPTGVHVKWMGFETNNPLHDDHVGKGAHFHIALRCDEHHALAAAFNNYTPHLYIHDDGRLKSGAHAPGRTVFNLGTFGFNITSDGRLDMGAIVRLRSARSDKFLHVRKSACAEGDDACQWADGDSVGSLWILHRVPNTLQQYFTLCNVRNGLYLAVPPTPNDRSPLVQLAHSWGAVPPAHVCWELSATDTVAVQLGSAVSPTRYMHVRKTCTGDRDPVVQWSFPQHKGNKWHVERAVVGSAWLPLAAPPAAAIPDSYSVQFCEYRRQIADGGPEVEQAVSLVTKNGVNYRTVMVQWSPASGHDREHLQTAVDVEERACDGDGVLCRSESVVFHSLTGRVLSHVHK
eukprot:gnl/Spiro4/8791_TR4620_c0_g1_i1.p1 gnl/Spiro4/8791_TR4620_c0_g1~~gnl/Spiro4/8791_TR4620_c0_g1_i1.p1  ORF type:complete len:620 (+),score=162.18 gnl/Spiro4/8791_TR4620_c0_g1_i1:48-1862(+)